MVNIYFVSQRVACLLRKVVQEIERRISTQAEHLRTVRIILPCFKKKIELFLHD
jgi:kinesin family protein C2/C3